MPRRSRHYQAKTAVVTGVGSGTGRAIARLLNANGVRAHCADVNVEAADTAGGERSVWAGGRN